MQRTSVVLFLLVLLSTPFVSLDAQQQLPSFTALESGTPIERTIAPGQAHFYSLKLEAGQFAQVGVDQHGIDVIISVARPDSKKLGDFDSPNGDEGPENITIVAETAGEYTLVVKPLGQVESVKPGKYEIRVIELRKATEQELSALADSDAMRDKALALVKDASLTIPQIRSLPTRVHAQMKAADLLWDTDETAASKLMTDAVVALKEFINAIDYADMESIANLQPATVLRYELIQALAVHDPEAALNFLRSTRPPVKTEMMASWGVGDREDQLELTLAGQVARQDPKRAYQIAQENLKTRLSANLFHTVMQLLDKDPELARKLARDINAKLLQEKLLQNREATELALNLIRTKGQRSRSSTEANSQGTSEEAQAPLLSDQDRRELLQKALNEALTPAPNSSVRNERETAFTLLHTLKQIGPDLEAQIPGSQIAVEKRITELQKQIDPQRASWQKYEQVVNSGTPEAAAESISQSPPEIRSQLYQQLADRTAAKGDINRARQLINEQITNPFQRRQALQNLEQQAIYGYIAKGKIEDALRALSVFRPMRARASIIAQVARQIGPGRKRAVAIGLLEQARSLLGDSPQADNQDEMSALLEIAIAFARYDTKRSFEIVEPLVDQFNEINEGARRLSGFGQESHKEGEVDMYNGNLVMSLMQQLAKSLAALGTNNFEKAKAAADRIQAPEVRLVTYLTMAEQILKPGRQ